MLTTESMGDVYCPFSSQDPEHCLHALLQQTECHLILIHYLNKVKFNNNTDLFDADSILTDKDVKR